MLDFSVLEEIGKVAIHCVSQEDAALFVEEMRKQHPSLMNRWPDCDDRWDWYGKYTCYAPHIYDKESAYLQFSPVNYWIEHGYTIVPFIELIAEHSDFGEFEPNKLSLSAFLGE